MARWYGKVLGFIAGWLLLRHPAGALLGLAIGHALDTDMFRGRRPGALVRARDADCAVLGVAPGASDAEIERAYRRAIAQCHPDRLASATPEERRRADARASELNRAYERLRPRR
jgi:DnaJ-domain-containing protein 1